MSALCAMVLEAILIGAAIAFTFLAIGVVGGLEGWLSAGAAWGYLTLHHWYWSRVR